MKKLVDKLKERIYYIVYEFISGQYGSSLGLLISVPLYYFWGFAGIVPSLILAAGFSALIAWLYVRKVNYVRWFIRHPAESVINA